MIFDVFILIAFVFVAIGSYTDLKTLEVPDWVNYSLIALGLGGNIIYSVFYRDYSYVLRSLLGLLVSLGIGLAMFYTGQWGGGDSKMLFGLGALLGIDFNFELGFFLKFLVNMLFAGALYGLVWISFKFFFYRKKILPRIREELKKSMRLRMASGLLSILCLAALYFLPYFEPATRMVLSILFVVLYLMNYVFAFVKAVEEVSMIRLIEPEKLTEGDWIVEPIRIDGKYVAGPKDLGIEKKQIARLIELKKHGKISKVKVKYGIPFVPSFFIALVYTTVFDNIVLMQFFGA